MHIAMKKKHLTGLLTFLLAFGALVLLPALVSGQRVPVRGYQSRACGLDMNRNGIIGEPEDCQVCDGSTLDPDFDGILEDLIYVDCDHGTDNASCGDPASPCRSIQFAWNERGDGSGDGAEDIVCFRGTCLTEENSTIGSNGVEGVYIRPKKGSEAIDWEYPSNPTMLVGWDHDDDGQYPPHDRDDVAVLDGGPNALTRTFHISANGTKSYAEMAHFTVRDYGRFNASTKDIGFLRLGLFGPVSSHGYLHDLQLERINRDRPSGSSISVFNFFRGGSQPRWWAFENINVVETASWLVRGAAQDNQAQQNGPFRFKNFSVTVHGCSQDECGSVAAATMFKLWGYVSGVEILDSRFDLQPDVWGAGGNPSNGVSPAQCSQDWTIRNNEFYDFQRVLNIQVTAEDACDRDEGRPVKDVIFDRNIWINDYPRSGGDTAVKIEAGLSIRATLEDLIITNNLFYSSDPLAACFWSDAGNPNGKTTGLIRFIGNTCFAEIDRFAAIYLNAQSLIPDQWYPHQDIEIRNNIIAGLTDAQYNFYSAYEFEKDLEDDEYELRFKSSNNIWDLNEGERFFWTNENGTRDLSTVDEWQGFSDAKSAHDCLPKFRSTNDPHLAHDDTCAVDQGLPFVTINRMDFDGQERGLGGAWDIGGDELSPPTFLDGFESGTTNAWSAVRP